MMGLKDLLALQDASTDGTAHEASSPSSSECHQCLETVNG